MQKDYIIIGSGLAAFILAWELSQAKKDYWIIGEPRKGEASRISSGMINPITGKRFAKSWNIDQVLPAAKALYTQFSQLFETNFFTERTIYRVFKNTEERELALDRLKDPHYQTYLGEIIPPHSLMPSINDPYGSVPILQGGTVNVRSLLDYLGKVYLNDNSWIQRPFIHENLKTLPDGTFNYGHFQSKAIIFAEGYWAIHNPWFKKLHWAPAKGEILVLHPQKNYPNAVLNNGNWTFPLPDGTFRIGASYDWSVFDGETTQAGEAQLRQGIGSMLPEFISAPKIDHFAGVRPATKDAKPYIGKHPEIANMYLFNGFGSKGTLLMPYYAKQLLDLMFGKTSKVDPAVDLQRHWKP